MPKNDQYEHHKFYSAVFRQGFNRKIVLKGGKYPCEVSLVKALEIRPPSYPSNHPPNTPSVHTYNCVYVYLSIHSSFHSHIRLPIR